MEFSNYLTNGENDIIKLKEQLMEKEATSTTICTKANKEYSVSDELNKKISTILGEIFEENIREGLKFKYNFEESSFQRKLKYRKITTSSKTIILLKDNIKTIKINGILYSFILNNNHSITIKDYKNNEIETIEDYQKIIDKTLNGEKIIFFPLAEIEANGIYEINGFNFSMIDLNEVAIIYSNVEEGKKDFNMAIIEARINKAQISELVKQIKKDNNIFGKKLKKKIVYLGFINSPTIDSNSKKNFEKLKKINCVIYGIKESKFAGKNVLKPIDWDLLNEVKGIKKRLDNIEFLLKLYVEKEPKKEKKLSKKKRNKSSSQGQKNDVENSDDVKAYE